MLKYIPNFLNNNFFAATLVTVDSDGRIEAVDKESFPSVDQNSPLFDTQEEAIHAAEQRWSPKAQPTNVSKYLARIGAKGGSAKSTSKTVAVRENGKKGGRPKTR